ncbi:MAG: hypothetical protein A3F12_05935 [Gammaproteobacteria bacterium RIFCSPHIGHO2_12_FULL_38_14]|nr:MAG: hypothetical protein A3F12_05935 [Gammaproteobacteria bacterium RIFCSPHIGHO2_12_FULL_38_14]
MKIVADAGIPSIKDYFAVHGELVLKPGRLISREDVKNADILLVRSITPVNESLLTGSSIRWVGSVTAGADHLDIAWLEQNGIRYYVASGFNAPPVADYVMSVVASLQDQQLLLQKKIKAAIIGVGYVGSIVAKRFQSLGMEVLLCDPPRAEIENEIQFTPFHDIHDVDLISLHVPLTTSSVYPTYHMIDRSFLEKQKAGCILINTSRGAVIDDAALKNHGQHLKWCLDVFQHEPLIDEEILQNAFIATPHIAGYSVQSKMRGIDMIYKCLGSDGVIKQQTLLKKPELPTQTLTPSTSCLLNWRDVLRLIFDPLAMTNTLRHTLSATTTDEERAYLFDQLRHHFTNRHEFHYTNIHQEVVRSDQCQLLSALGIRTC